MDVLAPARRYWGVAFAFIGLGAATGGVSHGFAPHFDDVTDAAVWKLTVYSIGVSSFCAVAGTLRGTALPRPAYTALYWLNAAALLVYAGWMANHDEFKYVIYHYAPSMLAVALLKVADWFASGAKDAGWIVAGVVVTFAGAFIQQGGYGVNRWFNHNDVFHVVQIAGLVLFYLGVRRLDDRARAVSTGSPGAHRA